MQVNIKDTFNVDVPKNMAIEVQGADPGNAFVPDKDPNYEFIRSVLSDVLAWYTAGKEEPLMLVGPTGAGKSSILCQIAARLDLPIQEVVAHSRLETPELIGHHTVVNGDMVFVDGPLTTALRYGHLFVLDEYDILDPGTAAGLNEILQGKPLVIPENGGEVVKPHPNFRFVATGNTVGNGGDAHLFQGVMRQNMAFVDRFWIVQVDYPDEETEKKIMEKAVPSLPAEIRGSMIDVAGHVRRLFKGEADESTDAVVNGGTNSTAQESAIEITMSTRTLIRWGKLMTFFSSLSNQGVKVETHSIDRAFAYKARPETREAIHEIVQRVMGD